MTRGVRVAHVGAVALAMFFGSWLLGLLWERSGHSPLLVPWSSVAFNVAIAIALLAFGWPVRRYQHSERGRSLDGLRAARTLALAQAGALTGAAIVGVWLGQLVLLAPDLDLRAYQAIAWRLVAAVVSGVVVIVAGLVVQGWCRVRRGPKDDDVDPGRAAARRGD